MTDLTPIRDALAPVERDTFCGCGAAIHQTGLAGSAGTGAFWSPKYCALCAAERIERHRQDDDDEAARVKERSQQARNHAIASLEVPPLYADATLEAMTLHGTPDDKLVQQRAITVGRRYCDQWPDVRHHLLILSGGPGTGKGHWTWSVVRWLVAHHGTRVRVVKLADLIRELRAGWKRDAETSEEETLEVYRTLDLLVIDEVSRHAFYGENIHQHLYDVLDHRIEYQRPTLLTTNEDETGIEAILRPALWDRVFGSGGVVPFGTASYRQKRATDRAITSGDTP